MVLCISQARAQGTDADNSPPVFEEILVTSEPNAPQRFWARVVDNIAVEKVILSYRLESETTFHKLPMQLSEQADWFYAELDDDIATDSVIDYYIQAVDTSGNPYQQGHKFNPTLSSRPGNDVATAAASTPVMNTRASSGIFGTSISTRTALYGVLGVLAVGAVAASLNSDSGGEDSPEGCTDEGCLLTITAPTL